MKGALDIHRDLLGKDVPHEIIRLRRPVLDADDLPDALGIDADSCVAVRVYVLDGQLIAVGVPAGRLPDPQALLLATGASTLRPATGPEINAATDYSAGLVAPLLLPRTIPFYVDARVGLSDVVYTATGDTGTALGIATAELLVSSGARVADLLIPSLAAIAVDLEV